MASGPYSKLPTADSATLSDEESLCRGLLPSHHALGLGTGLGTGLGMGALRRLTPSPSPGMTPSTSSVLMEDGKAGDVQATRDHVAIRTSCERARDRWRRGTSMIVQTRRVIALLSKVPGTAPGIDVKRQKFDFLSQHYRGDCDIQAVDYSASALTLQRVTRDNLESFLKQPRPAWSKVRWISVAGINWQVIQTLALRFDLHPLAVEDVVHMPQRIKADFYDNFIYISLILTMVAKAGHHAATAAQQQQQRQLQTLHGSYLPGLPPVRSPMQRSTQAARFMAGALQKWDALREGSVQGGAENQNQPLLGASFGRQSSSGDRAPHRSSTSGDKAPHRGSTSGEKASQGISGAGLFKRTSGSGQAAGSANATAASGSAGANNSGPNSEVCSGFTSPTAGEAAAPRFTSAPPVLVTTRPTGASPPDPRSPTATSVASSGMPLFEPRKGRMFGATGGANVTPLGHVAPNSVIRKVSVLSSQVSLFLMHDGTVLSVLQNRHETLTQPIVEQLRQARTLVRDSEDPSFLANLLVDAIVDHVYPVVDAFSEAVQQYETQVLCARPDPSMTRELHVLQGDLNTLKRTILPMYNLVHNLNTREEFSTSKVAAGPNAAPPAEIISRLTKTYLNDVKDHVSTITEHLEDLSAQCQHLSDLIFNLINYETNNATKTLAVVSVIFLPITFLAGVYGTNFTVLPEKDWEYGYLYFWLACVTITIVFVVALKRMGITLVTKQ